MIKIKQLTFENIGRFVSPQSIDFESLSHLVQVDAINELSSGSSGSGKSTIFQAIEFLFGCNDTPASILQSRLTKEKISVSALLEKNGKEFSVSRSGKGLSIQIDGVVTDGSIKLAEEKLQELIGIKPEYLRKMFHKRQGEGGFFLSMRPTESYEFLSDVLGAGAWTKKAELVTDRIKSLSLKRDMAKQSLEMQSHALKRTEDDLANSKAPEPPVLDETSLNASEADLSKLTQKLSELKANYQKSRDGYQSELQRELNLVPSPPYPIAPDRSYVTSLEAKVRALQFKIQTEQRELKEKESSLTLLVSKKENAIKDIEKDRLTLPAIQRNFEEIKEHILRIKDKKCPTCTQNWEGGQADQTFDSYLNRAKTLKKEIERLECLPSADSLNKDLEESKEKLTIVKNLIKNFDTTDLDQAQAEATKAQAELDEKTKAANNEFAILAEKEKQAKYEINSRYQGLIKQTQDHFDKEEAELSGNIRQLTASIGAIKTTKAAYEAALSQFEKNLKQLNENKAFAYGRVLDQKTQLEETEAELEIAELSAKMLKSFVSQLFQDALGDIAHRATAILRRIPNMSTASIQFESFKETKAGTIKAEINAVLSIDNEIGIPIKSLSGGERASVDLAADLAVLDVLELMMGSGLDILALDEPFTGLDSVNKEEILTILSQHCDGKKLIIVDHSEETKALVNDKITVIRKGQYSEVSHG